MGISDSALKAKWEIIIPDVEKNSDYIIKDKYITKISSNTEIEKIDLGLDDIYKVIVEDGKGKIKEIHVKDGYFRFHIESENVDVSNLYIREINVGKLLDIHDGTTIYSLSNEIFEFPEDGLMLTCVVDVLDKSKNIQIKGNDAKISDKIIKKTPF